MYYAGSAHVCLANYEFLINALQCKKKKKKKKKKKTSRYVRGNCDVSVRVIKWPARYNTCPVDRGARNFNDRIREVPL